MKLKDKSLYTAGAISNGMYAAVPSILLLYYCTQTLGLSPYVAGGVLLAPKLLALFFDPLVGRILDSFGAYPVRRAMLIAVGAALACLGFVLLFTTPVLGPLATAVWVASMYLLFCAGYSIFSVAHVAGPALLVHHENDRRTLVGMRIAGAMMGILLGAAVAPIIMAKAGGGRQGYAAMAVTIGVLCLLLAMGPAYVYSRLKPAKSKPTTPPPLWAALQIASFRWIAGRYLLITALLGAVSAATPYWITGIAKRSEADVGTAMGLLIVISMIAAPLWAQFARRIGDARALVLAFAGYGLATVAVGMAIGSGASWLIILCMFAMMGIPFAGIQVVPFTIIATIARDASDHSGTSSEGIITGAWTATEKLALALGPALTAGLLGLVGNKSDLSFLIAVVGIVAVASFGLCISSGKARR